jgi:hypothetical protein
MYRSAEDMSSVFCKHFTANFTDTTEALPTEGKTTASVGETVGTSGMGGDGHSGIGEVKATAHADEDEDNSTKAFRIAHASKARK